MKAIHNPFGEVIPMLWVGNYKLKYNFESNSQLADKKLGLGDVGNYKLKYNFESNSQLPVTVTAFGNSWEL